MSVMSNTTVFIHKNRRTQRTVRDVIWTRKVTVSLYYHL